MGADVLPVAREPSTPRIAVWRKLRRLGVAQLSDGLVALPADVRTREQLNWIAEEITELGEKAGVYEYHRRALLLGRNPG